LNKYLFSIAHNKPYWFKARVHKKILCNVCYTSQSSQLFSTKYCCSSVTHQICDTCVHQHIVSTLSLCLINSVSCPELNCRAIISLSVISDILLKYNNHDLLNNYLREQHWQGTSEKWIKRFTLRCPGCKVPIEKNGGCCRIICSQCKKHFYWLKSITSDENDAVTDKEVTYYVIRFMIVVLILVFISSYYILQ